MNKENCALKLVDEIILYYDARSKKHQNSMLQFDINFIDTLINNNVIHYTHYTCHVHYRFNFYTILMVNGYGS